MDWFAWITPEVFKNFIAPSLSPLFVVGGWFFVSRDNDRRETRKEIRTLLNDFCKRVDELERSSQEYFSEIDNSQNPSGASRAEIEIKRKIERLDSSIQLINKVYPNFGGSTDLSALADTITRHAKFESRPGAIVPHNDQFYLRLALACNKLTNSMEHQFIVVANNRFKLRRNPFKTAP
ncbi:hypothetical protein KDX09_31225 [Burkholderia cenocepacia]|uniref:hypothetical protein n=1 Tax=Burkholderia cenocepacia TaxID=95486 RepID=UPI001B9DDEDB|nr:hypothetical protein [Burkholderia cenocepacia]MBR8093840.1 hypothetical protein [Burkholderia cenocepacia]